MAGSVNKVILIGNLGQNPETRTMQNGGKVCNLSVATSERWRDRNSGEQRSRTEWHRVVIFDEKLVDIADQYLHKGSKIYLEGELQTRKWQDQSGADRYSTEVVLRRFRGQLTMLDSRRDDDDGEPRRERQEQASASEGNQGGGGRDPMPQYQPSSDALDDDIPF